MVGKKTLISSYRNAEHVPSQKLGPPSRAIDSREQKTPSDRFASSQGYLLPLNSVMPYTTSQCIPYKLGLSPTGEIESTAL